MPGVLKRKVLFWLNMILVAPLAAATLAGFAGEQWWVLDLFAHFRVQYLVVAGLLVILFLVLRARATAMVAALLLLINAVPVALLIFPRAQAAMGDSDGAEGIRPQHVMMMNVYVRNPDVQPIMRYVRKVNPDVLVLLEVTEQWRKPLERLASRYAYHWIHPGTAFTGIAVFSRTEPVETRIMNLGVAGRPSVLLTLGLGPDEERRLSLLGTHLSSPTGAVLAKERDRQLHALATVAREHIWPLAIVGDLNVSPFSPLFSRVLRDGRLKNCADPGLHPTWPSWAPPMKIQIDHCLMTKGVKAERFSVGRAYGSDHHGISVWLSPGAER